MTRLQPAILIDLGSERKFVLAPGHNVPGESFVGRSVLRLEDKGMTDLVGSEREGERHTVLRVAVDAVGADLLHELGDRIGPVCSGIACSLIPHHHRKEDAHAAAMKVGDHLFHAFDAAGHGAHHVVLIAVVDAHVRIGRPDENRIDAAVSLLEVVEIAIDRVLAGDRIVEVAVVHHHLRLNEAGLGPLQFGHA